MPTYRFPPSQLRGYFLAVVSFVLVVLVIPTLIAATVTPPEPKTEEVVLDSATTGFSEDETWTIEVPGLRCTPNSETMANQAWDCGATLVQVVSTEGLDGIDEEVAMHRAVRGYAYGEVSTAKIHREGDALALYDAPADAIVLSRDGEGDFTDFDYIVVLTGGDFTHAADLIWQAFGHRELPVKAETGVVAS